MRGLHRGYGVGKESSEKTLIYGGNSLVTTGTRRAEVLGVFFVSVFTKSLPRPQHCSAYLGRRGMEGNEGAAS